MSTTLEIPHCIQHFDTVSEASTDGDDCITLQNCAISSKKKNIAKTKAKSSLCKNFAEREYCPYGEKCQFAHGVEELRCNIDENAYKTKPCYPF